LFISGLLSSEKFFESHGSIELRKKVPVSIKTSIIFIGTE